jgi:hypothetical protein
MAYFMINNIDYSDCVSSLAIKNKRNYKAQTNASGDTTIDYINAKRTVEVGLIPLDSGRASTLLQLLQGGEVYISFSNPNTGALEEDVICFISEEATSYQTIRADKTLLKAFSLVFSEL